MPRSDARPLEAALVVLTLCFASGAVLAEEHRGRPDFKKLSMTRSSASPPTRASKPEMAAAPATRAGQRQAMKTTVTNPGKEHLARLTAPSTHRAPVPRGDVQPASRANRPTGAQAAREAATQPPTRSAGPRVANGPRAANGARMAADQLPIRSVGAGEARGPQRNSVNLDMARSAKPPYRAPVPDAGPRQDLAARAVPEEPSKRSAHATKEHLSVRPTRGTWMDWLFGR